MSFRFVSALIFGAVCWSGLVNITVVHAAPSFECMEWVVGSARHSERLRAEAFRVCDRLAILPNTASSVECARWVLGTGTSTMERRISAATACRFNVGLECTEFVMQTQGNFFSQRLSAAQQCQQETNEVSEFQEFDLTIAEWVAGRSSSSPALRMTIATAARGGAELTCVEWVLGSTTGDVDTRLEAVEVCNHVSSSGSRRPSHAERVR